MQSGIPIEELMLCCVFFHNKNNNYTFFYLALNHLPKFKRGQGQTSVILLSNKFFKKLYLKNSLQIVQGRTLLTLRSWSTFHGYHFFFN